MITTTSLPLREYNTKDRKLEKDPSGKLAGDLGTKLDLGKSPVFQGLINYFPNACIAVAEVSDFGSRKYVWGGWKTVPNGINRYKDAMLRHICKQSIDGDIDSDSGLLHAAHIAWGSLATLELILMEKQSKKPIIPQPQPSRTQHGI